MPDIFTGLAGMRRWIAQRDWIGLEQEFRERHARVDAAAAAAVTAVSLSRYERDLSRGLERAYAKAERQKAAALYWEYDLDSGWQSWFFVCPAYAPEAAGDDDWASDFDADLPGPGQARLARFYQESGRFGSDELGGACTLHLIARTVAAFGRVATQRPRPRFALCLAFHDQTPVVRIFEGEARAPTRPALADALPLPVRDELAEYLLNNYRALIGAPWSFGSAEAAAFVKSHAGEIVLNRCPQCTALARTVRAKQCRRCGFDWH